MFKLIGAEIKWYTERAVMVACEVQVKGERTRRSFHFPKSVLRATPDGLFIPAWLMSSRQERYRSMTGKTCHFVAELVS